MATIYLDAADDLTPYIDDALGIHHGLRDAGVTFSLLFAVSSRDDDGETDGKPPLKHHGYPAAAIIRIVSHRDRSAGMADVQLIVDGDAWPEWSEAKRAAVVDHELTHLDLRTDENGAVKRDDCGRPKIRMRLHDYEFGGFGEVAERHGAESVEVETLRRLYDRRGQQLFPWMEGAGV